MQGPFSTDVKEVQDSDLHEVSLEIERRKCGNEGCPSDGSWSRWSPWSECQGKCGKAGKRVRVRACDNLPSENGGTPCTGTGYKEEPCPNFQGTHQITQNIIKGSLVFTVHSIFLCSASECKFIQFMRERESGQLNERDLRLLQFLERVHSQNPRLEPLFDSPVTTHADVIAAVSNIPHQPKNIGLYEAVRTLSGSSF